MPLHRSQAKRKFRLRLIASYAVLTLLLIATITVVHIHLSLEHSRKIFSEQARIHAQEREEGLKREVGVVLRHLDTLALMLQKEPWLLEKRQPLQERLGLFVEAHAPYMQLRFLDDAGHERVRIERQEPGGRVSAIPDANLQDKSGRYYVEACCQLQSGQFWLSPFEPNVEHGEIERPLRPVLRTAVPVYLEGEYRGFLIANLFAEEILRRLTDSPVYDTYLLDAEGYYLIHPDVTKNWSHFQEQPLRLQEENPELAQALMQCHLPGVILEGEAYGYPLEVGGSHYRLIYTVKPHITQERRANENMIVVLILLLIAISAPILALLLSRPFDRIYAEMQERIEKEAEKSARMDQMMQHQAKLAALGELLTNITHQWRQPLTRISLILQNLTTMAKKSTLEPKMVQKQLSQAVAQTDFMSETIETFREFYAPNHQHIRFHAGEALERTLKILGPSLTHLGIKLQSELPEDATIDGDPTELSQVFLSILTNARDAFAAKAVSKPYIRITADVKGDTLTLKIMDNAGGIDPAIMGQLFERRISTKHEQGSGLGLMIVKLIIEEHYGGRVDASNEGEGACFTFEMPHSG